MVARLLVLFLGAASPVFAAEQAPDLFIEAVLDPPTAYVQSQVRYRVRLYRSSQYGQLGNGETGEYFITANKLAFSNCAVWTRRSTSRNRRREPGSSR